MDNAKDPLLTVLKTICSILGRIDERMARIEQQPERSSNPVPVPEPKPPTETEALSREWVQIVRKIEEAKTELTERQGGNSCTPEQAEARRSAYRRLGRLRDLQYSVLLRLGDRASTVVGQGPSYPGLN